MMSLGWKKLAVTVVGALTFALIGGTAVAGAAPPANSTCTGGTIAAGTYTSLTITGDCALPDSGAVTVNGGLTLAPGSSLNGITGGDLIVRGNVTVGSDAAFVAGCSEEVGCTTTSTTQISGGVTASQALAVVIHNATIRGNVSINGGGGGVTCDPLLLGISPAYMDLEDSQVNGGVSITGVQSCWLGFIRNHVNGSVTVSNTTLADDDANEIVTNQIHGNLSCTGNSPEAHVGDSGGSPNTVSGNKTGECAKL